MARRDWIARRLKPAVFLTCLVPVAWLAYRAFTGDLGANPIETLSRYTGDWTLRFLLIALAVTPARHLSGWAGVMRLRRMLGLFAFFYVFCHFCIYLFDQFFSLEFILEDILERPYVTVGFTSFVLLIPLAITSTNGWVKRLGGKRWQQLHRLVYLAAGGGVLHFLWKVKAEEQRPVVYGLVLVALLAFRLWTLRRASTRRGRPPVRVRSPAPSPARSE